MNDGRMMMMKTMGAEEDGSGGRARSTCDEASVERRRRDAIGGRETRRDASDRDRESLSSVI